VKKASIKHNTLRLLSFDQKIRNGKDAPMDRREYKTAACNGVWFSERNTAAPGKSPLEAASL